ncbi:MAG TPA: hypothetical protein VKZ77_01025 [Bacillaceae bacterium]|nr:hypothetical protein [Bacillaceae bacterium]
MKKSKLFLCFAILILLSGCFPTGPRKDSSGTVNLNNDNDSDHSEVIPSFVDLELDENLLVNANVNAPNNEKIIISSITLKEFEEDKLERTFFENKKVVEMHKDSNYLFPEYDYKSITFSDASSLFVDLGTFRFYDSDFYKEREYENVISGSTFFIRSDLKEVYKQESLDEINKDDAIELVRSTIQDLGIRDLGNPKIIALDLETLKSEWEDYEGKHGEHPRKWEKADEAYVITFPVLSDKLNITSKGYFSATNNIPVIGSRVMGVVTKDGLIYLTANGIYDIGEKVKNDITPISLETALESVKNKYKDVIVTDPIVISNIALEYMPIVSNVGGIKYELIPAWVFTATQEQTFNDIKGKFTSSTEFTIFINAETGQEIRSGGEY